jgi:hypothetical protein
MILNNNSLIVLFTPKVIANTLKLLVSIFQTHWLRQTGQQFGSLFWFFCSQSGFATISLLGSFATFLRNPKYFGSQLLF